jgi:hypothetical protein
MPKGKKRCDHCCCCCDPKTGKAKAAAARKKKPQILTEYNKFLKDQLHKSAVALRYKCKKKKPGEPVLNIPATLPAQADVDKLLRYNEEAIAKATVEFTKADKERKKLPPEERKYFDMPKVPARIENDRSQTFTYKMVWMHAMQTWFDHRDGQLFADENSAERLEDGGDDLLGGEDRNQTSTGLLDGNEYSNIFDSNLM